MIPFTPPPPLHTREIRYWELDSVRFFAAFAVMFLHYFARGYAEGDNLSPYHFPTIGPYSMYGYLAVNLFFMISGFVILVSAQGKAAGLTGTIDFARSRFLRLYPAYWVACTLTFVFLYFVYQDVRPTSIGRYLINMTMLNGFFGIGGVDGVYWTLFVELRFYILVGVIVWLGMLRSVERLLWAWVIISGINLYSRSAVLDYIFFTEFAPWFICGCFYYVCRTTYFDAGRVLGILSANAVGLAYALQDLHEREAHYGVELSVPVLVVLVFGFNALFLLIGRSSSPRKGTLLRAISDALGGASYPLYLLHAYIGYVLFNIAPPSWNPLLVVVLVMALMCLASFLMWRWVEPAIREKLKLLMRSTARRQSLQSE